MANKVVAALVLALMKADFDLDTADVRCFGVSSAYTFNTAHDFLDDVSTGIITDVITCTGEAVASVTGGGNFDVADPTLTNVNGAVAGIWFYDHQGAANANRRLLVWFDTATGLPTASLTAGSVPITVNA